MMLPVGLLDRILTVLEDNGWSETEWSRRAGLKEATHVSTLIRRLRGNPNATLDAQTAAKLADAANVSLDWLLLGRGTKGGAYIVAQADARYPTRGVAIAAGWTFGYKPEAIKRVLCVEHFPEDPGLEYWLALLKAENEIAGRLLPAPPDDATSQEDVAAPDRR